MTLRKVAVLTLYLIELKKENESLKKSVERIDELERKPEALMSKSKD